MIDRTRLAEQAAALGIALTPEHLSRLDRYAELLVEWNERMNLTAITGPDEVAVKHFLDSLLLLRACEVPPGARLVDVGTGAGFPGVPVAILRGDLQLTLLDSLNKRLTFLQALCEEVGVRAALVHARAEEAGQDPAHRARYDLATARAVAPLAVLCEYCLPLVRTGGVFAALKGPDAEAELATAGHALQVLGGRVQAVRAFTLPDGSQRSIVVIEKCAPTPKGYPRPYAKLKKAPL